MPDEPAAAPSLAELQRHFQHFVVAGSGDVGEHVAAPDEGTRRQRLAIYADAYALRLEEALRADYRGLHAWLGDGEFRRLTRDYLPAHPSHYRSIRWFGAHLEEFLATVPGWRNQPQLAEMARLDWALSLTLDAADAPALEIGHMAAIPPEDWPGLTFRLHPAVRRLDLRWSVPALRIALLAGERPPAAVAGPEPIAWLIWRGDLKARFRSLPIHEAWALDTAARGVCFANICEGLCQWLAPADSALEAATLLKRWVVDGLLLVPDRTVAP